MGLPIPLRRDGPALSAANPRSQSIAAGFPLQSLTQAAAACKNAPPNLGGAALKVVRLFVFQLETRNQIFETSPFNKMKKLCRVLSSFVKFFLSIPSNK
jgi:hypothetical protein